MREYEQKVFRNRDNEPLHQDQNVPTYMSLAAQYGLDDDMDMSNLGNQGQTYEQEHQAYVTAPCSPPNTNILKHWEVGG